MHVLNMKLELPNSSYSIVKICIDQFVFFHTFAQIIGPPLSKLPGETNNLIDTMKPEKIIGNLLPKRDNNDPRRRPPSPTSANLYRDDKEDILIIPEPIRRKRPKPPPSHPKSFQKRRADQSDDSPSPPLPPKHPRAIPACSSGPVLACVSDPVPKCQNTSKARGKAVRFDASVPAEEEPPPLPKRGVPPDPAPKFGSPYVPKYINTEVEIHSSDGGSSEATASTDIPSDAEVGKPTGQAPCTQPAGVCTKTMSIEA